jgi:hypothetical protein
LCKPSSADADAAAKGIAGNPERLDARHGKNAAALVTELRLSGARMEALRKMLHLSR